ncbi:1-acyl-sn-glycerol-3-phosphate acyltransferase [Labrenzia sp. EL_208]|uniref:2-acyl-glycerophospho-ethanolamine acyltransferase n=1 Tax=Roseibium album TaxID=311410 RepID=A0A0M7AIE8_9HYPH|nr:lysophospholipid acyltransferase family protein [Roseibium album]MBG6172367.1 1-acyl-sn-glycerol-3-phosphate acyltransferase [Labrenzia sp. EL_132]MBG6227415.1 1-acyl-sn-glycerol-3-phosphate acyltransferase [Labrenzia sp. EL_208]CTQ59388.1 2-acyl-glycerophospho-ethanolamine acyltransferase [Roseibium album]CTQ64934.1 2-acyl-glycerophospho-ethanolamine acyltransferase [Roseibium album]CTQ74868.1 2-acyl-glycerophospho-ethanolamine acyltransferase [Roseibium album]
MLQKAFYSFVKIAVLFLLGLNVRRKDLLPSKGPAIIVANHNSHLDTMVLMALMPLSRLKDIKPVAAADYFFSSPRKAWLSEHVLGIIPVERTSADKSVDPLEGCYEALAQDRVLILFPEGSRGKPEQMTDLKKGVSYLAERFPDAPVVPVFTHGLGKALPKGSFMLVPFFCDIFVGEPITWPGNRTQFMDSLKERFSQLSSEKNFASWE